MRLILKKLLSLIFYALLTACSTGSLEAQKPIFEMHTDKDIDTVNRCIAPKWLELRASSTSIPTASGYKITASDDIFGALSIVNIDKSSGSGSDVKVYAVARGWNDHWANAAKSCM